MTDIRRPYRGAQTELRQDITADQTDIPVISLGPFRPDADKLIGDEFVRCTGFITDSLGWPVMTGCERGVAQEDGGSTPKPWPGGTEVSEVGWTAVDILTTIPIPTRDMAGRQFQYQDAEGNLYTFNVVVVQDGEPYIDWVNKPPGLDTELELAATAVISTLFEPTAVAVNDIGLVYASEDWSDIEVFLDNFASSGDGLTTGDFSSPTRQLAVKGPVSGTDRLVWSRHNKHDIFYRDLTVDATGITAYGTAGDWGVGTIPSAQGIVSDGTHVWVTDRALNKVVKFLLSDGSAVAEYGSSGSANGQFNQPGQIARDASGNFYVADTSNNRVSKWDSNFAWVQNIIASIVKPIGVAVDSTGDIFVSYEAVADSDYRVRRYSSGGVLEATSILLDDNDLGHLALSATYLFVARPSHSTSKVARVTLASFTGAISAMGAVGTGNGQFTEPFGIAYSAARDSIYVSDQDQERVQELSSAGAFLQKWGSDGIGNGQFQDPQGVTLLASGDVLVADQTQESVQRFTAEGVFVQKYGHGGPADLQFGSPAGLFTDGTNLWVAEAGRHRVHKINVSTGAFVAKFGSFGTADGQFDSPEGMFVDGSGNVWVADTGNDRIQKFNSSHVHQLSFGTSGFAEGQFNGPTSLAVDDEGRVWVADTGNHRIQVFDPAGVFLASVGSFGAGTNQFKNPSQIAAKDDLFLVADELTGRIMAVAQPTGDAGFIQMTASLIVPSGWLLCDGSAVSREEFSRLFTAIGTIYGPGDGSTTFELPDLRDRFPLGRGAHPDNDTLGELGGTRLVALTASESGLPAHSHSIPSGQSGVRRLNDAGANNTAGQGGGSTVANAPEDAASSHENMPPFLTLNFIIKT